MSINHGRVPPGPSPAPPFTFAAAGCPADDGSKQCARVDFSNFTQLANRLDGRGDGTLWVDPTIEDYQIDVGGEGEADDHAHSRACRDVRVRTITQRASPG